MTTLLGYDGFHVEVVAQTTDLTLALFAQSATALCPVCMQPAARIQSRYLRRLSDSPIHERVVHLVVHVRRFFCDTAGCPRRIFAERFPDLMLPYAKQTTRLRAALRELGLGLGGEAGKRIGAKFGYRISGDTLLRLARSVPLPPVPPPTAIGIDDWAIARGQHYGTIIVDLRRHRVIDLLPDRTKATVAAWLKEHPTITLIARDRWTDYASAARDTLLTAVQVADRYHLVANLVAALKSVLARLRHELRPPDPEDTGEIVIPPLPQPETWQAPRSPALERTVVVTREHRLDQYAQIVALRAHGLTQKAIAARVGLSERTVRKHLAKPTYQEMRPHLKRRSIFDPYAAYVLQRWREGMHDGHQLYNEIAAQGFRGGLRTVQRYLHRLRPYREGSEITPPTPLEALSSRKAVWLFVRDEAKLTVEERLLLSQLRSVSPTIDHIYGLVQEFRTMVHTRRQHIRRLDDTGEGVQCS